MTVVVPVPAMPVGMGLRHNCRKGSQHDQRKQELLHLFVSWNSTATATAYIPKRAQLHLVVASCNNN
jgi:hypothetical protein